MEFFFFVNEEVLHPETRDVILWPGCYVQSYIIAKAEDAGVDYVKGMGIFARDIDEAMDIFRNVK